MANQCIGVGLIGFGFSGRVFHAPVIHATAGMCLTAVMQRSSLSEADAETMRKAYPQTHFVQTIEQLLSFPEIRLIVIATPNTSHFDLARKSLLAGRDVVIDKPFANNYREAADLINLAQQQGRSISAYHNSRCHGDFHTVRQLLKAGRLGRIARCEMHIDRYRPQLRPNAWRERAEPGSGVFFDLGPHLIDQALVLFGQPEAISADIRIERDHAAADDAFDLTLHYPCLKVLLCAGMLAAQPRPRFLLHGTLGAYVKFGADPQEDALRQGGIPGSEGWGLEPKEKWGSLTLALEQSRLVTEAIPTEAGDYRRYYENVRDTLLGLTALAVTSKQILDVMHILELAQQSSQKQQRIPW